MKRYLLVFFTLSLLLLNAVPVLAADPELVDWEEYPSNPVFDPAERAYYPSILFDGTTYRMWYDDGSGTRYTTSTDGINWAVGTPLTGLVNGVHACVESVGSQYMVWYWDTSQLYSINTIRCAESTDGINWTADAAITQVGTTVITGNPGPDWNAGSYGPCDVFYNPAGSPTRVSPVNAAAVWQNRFVMYYDGTTGGLEDIGLAVSADGRLWEGYNGGSAPVLPHGASGTWDDGYTTFGTVQKINGIYHLWYSGGRTASNEGIGYAQSADGVVWTKYAGNPIMRRNDGVPWRASRTYTPMVIYNAGGFGGHGESADLKMWYTGVGSGNYAIGYAKITALPAPTATANGEHHFVTVGGETSPVSKITVLAPFLIISLLIASVIAVSLYWQRTHIIPSGDKKRL